VSIKLNDEEAWAFLRAGHTGILSTLRADGYPVALPIWFVVENETIYTRTPVTASKIKRIRRDSRGSFLVEHGLHWRELQAVVVPVDARVVDDQDLSEQIFEKLDTKYEEYRSANQPDTVKRHYAENFAIAMRPTGPFVTWDNTRLRLPDTNPHS
jgi:nitroimidazol reductase NimA-like FMN-containing flavoprotein (pyridoxamine 5'-phosphate oxidase superfamily)